MLSNTHSTYGLIAQLLHWAVAILILVLLPLGLYMDSLPIGNEAELQNKFWFYSLHKTLGVTVFAIAIIRVLWAIIQPRPALLNGGKKLENFAAHTVHWILYGSIILMPLSGWLHHSATEGFAEIWWPFLQDLPFVPKDEWVAELLSEVHFTLGVLLVVSLFLHIGGAMKHAVIDHDGTLARMIPGMTPKAPEASISTDEHTGQGPILISTLAFLAVATFVAFEMRNESPQLELASQTPSSDIQATPWIVDHKDSTLGIEIIQSGKPVDGLFKNWNATINFDPDNLENSQVIVDVDIASLSLGSVTQQALSTDVLNVTEHPTAKFIAREFVSEGNGKYVANGELTLVGITALLSLPFNLKIEDDDAVVEGRAVIKRLDFNVGAKTYSTDQTIGFEVTVLVNLEADKQD